MKKKILCLSKRRPQQRDLITSPYGRFFNLPRELSKLGHDVSIAVLSHTRGENQSGKSGELNWYSFSLSPNPVATYLQLKSLTKTLEPDWIVGFSDTYYGILSVHLAKSLGTKSMVDAYDNYAAYIPWAKPLHYLWYRAIADADIVTVAGPSIAKLITQKTNREDVKILPMAPDEIGFYYKDKFHARQSFRLPNDKIMFGYCGAISHTRGIDVLFDAYKIAKSHNPNIGLVLSGRTDGDIQIPRDAYYLGFVPNERLPYLINALDAMVVPNKNSEFGKYSYPIKLYEAMASGIGIIASETPATKWILERYPNCLVEAENAPKLAEKMLEYTTNPTAYFDHPSTWKNWLENLTPTSETS